jgi:hypothetical protein
VDRERVTRDVRRRQVLEELESERSRAEALREQLEALVAERDGPALDERLFAAMDPREVDVVRPAVQAVDPELFEPEEPDEAEEADGAGEDAFSPEEEHAAYQEAEIGRLAGEIESSAARQRAFQRYLDLLDH